MFDLSEFVVFDFETTGLDPENDRVIEVAAVRVVGGAITAKYTELFNPGEPLSEKTQELTGLTDAMLKDCRPSHYGDSIRCFIGKSTLVGHNVHFDLAFLYHQYQFAYTHDFLDTRALALALFPYKKTTLDATCEHCGITRTTAHRAMADVLDTLKCLQRMEALLMAQGRRTVESFANEVYGFRKYASTPPYVPQNGTLILL